MRNLFKFIMGAWVVTLLVWLTVVGGLIFTAVHFIKKFW